MRWEGMSEFLGYCKHQDAMHDLSLTVCQDLQFNFMKHRNYKRVKTFSNKFTLSFEKM